MNEQNNMKTTWWKRNKKKVLIIGGVVIAVGVGVLIFKNKKAIVALLKGGKKLASNVPKLADPNVIETSSEIMNAVDKEAITVHKMLNNGLPFEVKGFIRELPNGQHPSAEKIAQAAALGIELGEHQTFVNPYIKMQPDRIQASITIPKSCPAEYVGHDFFCYKQKCFHTIVAVTINNTEKAVFLK